MNLADLVRAAAEDFPAKPALVFGGRTISYVELDDLVDLTAAALARFGVTRGDRVALVAGNIPEFVYGLYGTARAGAVACPLNVMLTPEEIRPILADCGAKAAIIELPYLPSLMSIRGSLGDLETILVIGGPPAPAGTVSLEEALSADEGPPDVTVDSTDLALIAYTAGTTADPKGAMLTHGNLLANLDQVTSVPALAQTEEDVVLLALPLFHIYAMNAVLGTIVKSGATAVLVERFDPGATLDLVQGHDITILVGAPPMFSSWLAVAEASESQPDLSSVRMAISGASALDPEVMHGFQERFGITIWEGYGLTEAAPVVTTNAAGPEARPGSIGLPVPGVEIRLVDERGDDVDPEEGDPGEVLVRGPNVFAGYWNRPDATAEVLQEGWLRTGDVAYQDEDGYLFLVDRKKDLIIVSGFNVFPKEVEEAIASHPEVEEAAVVGIPDERTGEAVQAWVVPVPGAEVTPQAVLRHLEHRLARFKWPKDVQVVDELPRHVTGKVLRRFLRGQEEMLGSEEMGGEEGR
jgi:long-chain acyl-CoA synthetase